ncbi:MAG: peptide chain release factor N(5)-glutamine methyltransferase [Bryobacteraceae bacterium]
MNVRTALSQGTQLLADGGVSAPRLTAEVLLAHAMRRERAWFYGHPEEELSEIAWIHYGRYLHERIQGKPTQYITRRQEFYGREFHVTTDVLIPRPETECAVEAALARLRDGATVIDVGCGSGAIAVTLALERTARVFATDLSQSALRVAAGNAHRLGAAVSFVACDLLSAFAEASADVVVSNPPYVALRDAGSLQREVRDWEPRLALFGGDDGLDVCRRLIRDARRVLRPRGRLVVEIAYNAGEEMRRMLVDWENVETHSDMAGLPRVIAAERGP